MGSKIFLAFLAIVALFEFCQGEFYCKPYGNLASDFVDTNCYQKACAEKIESHIKEEFKAAFSYMHLAAKFDQDTVSRPGLAKFFYGAASEEREHAIMMMDYLNLRGYPFDKHFSFHMSENTVETSISYRDAMTHALNMEVMVTEMIQKILNKCNDDLHAQDKFTDPIMDEQHNGIRKLQVAIRTFDNMQLGVTDPAELAFSEYIFDQKLLKGEIM